MRLAMFTFIDEVLQYKKHLRFELESGKRALDAFFRGLFQGDERYINYTSRIKSDESLKEKIIRQNLYTSVRDPKGVFDEMPDIIGVRLECRFLSDEALLYERLRECFPSVKEDGYFQSDRDPRIELNLSEEQPQTQKNGFPGYRIDGRFFGDRVLNFELQIKSIVNVFWNEIDHKILYKNYNYVVTEDFVRQLMNAIRGDLGNIDKQMEMVYDHLRSLDTSEIVSTDTQLRDMTGRWIQEVYVNPLRDREGILLDFRSATDLITEFLYARVQYESRESFATEFVRIMDVVTIRKEKSFGVGEIISLPQPIRYHNEDTRRIGKVLEKKMNEGIKWNLLVHILIDLNGDQEPWRVFRTFVDYLYFILVKLLRRAYEQVDLNYDDPVHGFDALTDVLVDWAIKNLTPDGFKRSERRLLKEHLVACLEAYIDHKDMRELVTQARRLLHVQESEVRHENNLQCYRGDYESAKAGPAQY